MNGFLSAIGAARVALLLLEVIHLSELTVIHCLEWFPAVFKAAEAVSENTWRGGQSHLFSNVILL